MQRRLSTVPAVTPSSWTNEAVQMWSSRTWSAWPRQSDMGSQCHGAVELKLRLRQMDASPGDVVC